ncbi:polyprenyl synthetase family protein [Rossellomorea aquimaris]|uniref:polyprenyl synthetase family protein n=1 Tax=Rossellomorea aquimaris TaxID=189382 RepID=UPI000A557DDE|nr:farnesyl diphosphate synthase [Rossellomorea aquimaris]
MNPQSDLQQFQQHFGKKIEECMIHSVQTLNIPNTLKESMIYSLQAGGKRIRPVLLLATIQAFNKNPMHGLNIAASLEMVHTYSLIHDDLPSMDDDDLRRGKPTNHKVFGEALSILAGDGLLTYSFQLIAQDQHLLDEQKIHLIDLLAKSAGPEGMVGGQVSDIEGENQTLTVNELQSIHENKTGKLLTFSVLAGAVIAQASLKEMEKLQQFAYHIGLAFQIQDDILDVEGSEELIGKPVGSDESKHKSTYPSLLTMQGAKEKLQFHLQSALDSLESINIDSTILKQIAQLIADRNH